MTNTNENEAVPVKGKTKYAPKGKRYQTVGDVIERCIKTGEPIPEDYKHRDPNEVISVVVNE